MRILQATDGTEAIIMQVVVMAIARAGGTFRYTRAEYEAAIASLGADAGDLALFDWRQPDPDHIEVLFRPGQVIKGARA